MNQKEEKLQGFFATLTTPLGLGTAIAVSAGIGISFYFLHQKLQKPKTEYEKMIQQIKKHVKIESRGSQKDTYSDSLVQMVYKTTPMVIQEALKTLYEENLDQRLKAINEAEKSQYKALCQGLNQAILSLIESTSLKIVEEAEGSKDRFKRATSPKRRQLSRQLKFYYEGCINSIVKKAPTRPNKATLSKELFMDILDFKRQLLSAELSSRGVEWTDGCTGLIVVWIYDRVYEKFGVDIRSEELRRLRTDFVS